MADVIISFFIVLVAILVLTMLFVGIKNGQNYEAERTQSYQECKVLTGDIEWCFKNFNPVL